VGFEGIINRFFEFLTQGIWKGNKIDSWWHYSKSCKHIQGTNCVHPASYHETCLPSGLCCRA